ncbi:MAG: hypothetical protein RIQ81_1260 [Pseudomonadota bacterium]
MNQTGPKPTAPCPADPVWTGDCARLVDQLSIEQYKIPQERLMDHAGKAVAAEAQGHGRVFLVLAGPGNNGGDALVAAQELSRDALNRVHVIRVPKQDGNFAPSLPDRFDCVIDGVLGLGFKGKLASDSPAAKVLTLTAAEIRRQEETLAPHKVTVVAVDLPSGLACDDAATASAMLPAGRTVTFGGIKAVHAIAPARDLCGKTVCAQIGFSSAAVYEALKTHPPAHAIVRNEALLAQNPWQDLPGSAHKFDRGHVLILGGSAGKTGAPVLSAMAALRSGAGWATVSIPPGAGVTTLIPPDLTAENLWMTGRHGHSIDSRKLEKFLSTRNVKSVVAGPGTMNTPLTAKNIGLLCEFAAHGCLVIDAGALQGIEELLTRVARPAKTSRIILTPHPGEWRRLNLGKHGPENWPAPLNVEGVKKLRAVCERLGIHVLYKHATPVLCGPEGFTIDAEAAGQLTTGSLVFNRGSNAMGRAGTGDVLAGSIAAHGAVGCTAGFATMRALSLVAKASELAAAKVGKHAVLPTDIILELGRAG